jgi:hypothetical protein
MLYATEAVLYGPWIGIRKGSQLGILTLSNACFSTLHAPARPAFAQSTMHAEVELVGE